MFCNKVFNNLIRSQRAIITKCFTVLFFIKYTDTDLVEEFDDLDEFFNIIDVIPVKGLGIVLLFNTFIAGLYLLGAKNPVYSLLSLIAIFLNNIVLLLAIKIEFLALTFLIIYVGAIAILFLFVIMMFNLKKLQNIEIQDNFWYTFFAYIILLMKTYPIICEYIKNFMQSLNDTTYSNICTFGKLPAVTNEFLFIVKYKTNDILIFSDLLYSYYSPDFILVGVILLTAMLGSIILALSTIENTDIFRLNA